MIHGDLGDENGQENLVQVLMDARIQLPRDDSDHKKHLQNVTIHLKSKLNDKLPS